MNTRDISFFIKVYECRSINEAAEGLYITPQGLSGIISKLEKELDCVLFNRDRGGTVPTECGNVFYKYALGIQRELDDMTSEISRISRLDKGIIRFGYSFGTMSDLSLGILFDFQKRYSEYKLEYTELPDMVIEELVESGALDVGFSSCTNPERHNSDFVSESKIFFVPRKSSNLYDNETVSVKEIAGEPLTLRNNNFATTRILMQEFERCGCEPDIILNTSGIMRSIKMCRDDTANTVIIDSVAEQFGTEEFRTIPFTEDLRWPLYMITKKGITAARSINCFVDYMKQRLGV